MPSLVSWQDNPIIQNLINIIFVGNQKTMQNTTLKLEPETENHIFSEAHSRLNIFKLGEA